MSDCLEKGAKQHNQTEKVRDVIFLEEMVSLLQDRLNLRKQAPFFMLITNPHFQFNVFNQKTLAPHPT